MEDDVIRKEGYLEKTVEVVQQPVVCIEPMSNSKREEYVKKSMQLNTKMSAFPQTVQEGQQPIVYVDQYGNPIPNPNINITPLQIQQAHGHVIYVDQNGNPVPNPNLNVMPTTDPTDPTQVRCCCPDLSDHNCMLVKTVLIVILIIGIVFLIIFWLISIVQTAQSYMVLGCFAANSTLWIRRNGDMLHPAMNVKLSEVEIGDYVLTMDPATNNVFWDEVLLKIHYSWYDDAQSYHSMRTLYLDDNTSITLSHNHFMYIYDFSTKSPKIIQSQLVEIGDLLFYYDYGKNQSIQQSVVYIDENVMRQKRAFFTMSPFVLVNNIVASPYIGPHPVYHTILHQLYVRLIFLRYFINRSVLAFLACCGYHLLLYPYLLFQMSVFAVFTVFSVLFVSKYYVLY